jgi:pimeloyl-ACP methyl ester carboxylesterase
MRLPLLKLRLKTVLLALFLGAAAQPALAQPPQVTLGYKVDAPATRIYFDHYVEEQVLTEDGIGLNLIEIYGDDGKAASGKPIILQHGYSQSLNTFYETAAHLRARGYRVFIPNMRGHGQGATRSVGIDGRNPDTDPRMVFDNLAAYDVPALIDHVYKLTGQKVTWLGHSMGGMMMHLALAGVSRNAQGRLAISKARSRWLASRVERFIAVGSPVNFEPLGKSMLVMQDLANDRGLKLDRSNSLSARLPFAGLFENFARSSLYQAGRLANPLKGLLNMRKISDSEYQVMLEYMGSDVPKNFSRSIDFVNKSRGYTSADGTIDYAKLSMGSPGDSARAPVVPTLIVSADHDMLAPLSDQTVMVNNRGLEQIIMKDSGHLDMTLGSNSDHLVSILSQHRPRSCRAVAD